MIVKYNTVPNQPLTVDENDRINAEIENAKSIEPQFDEDCPELSDATIKALKSAVRNRNRILSM